MKLSDFVANQAIVPSLQSANRDDTIKELVQSAVDHGLVDKLLSAELITQIIEREEKGSTGFGKGVAVPHVKHIEITKMTAIIGVSQKGIDFNALDTAPVYSVFLLLSPGDQPNEHLQAMENIFSNLQKDTFRRFLRQAADAQAIADLLQEADMQQLQG